MQGMSRIVSVLILSAASVAVASQSAFAQYCSDANSGKGYIAGDHSLSTGSIAGTRTVQVIAQANTTNPDPDPSTCGSTVQSDVWINASPYPSNSSSGTVTTTATSRILGYSIAGQISGHRRHWYIWQRCDWQALGLCVIGSPVNPSWSDEFETDMATVLDEPSGDDNACGVDDGILFDCTHQTDSYYYDFDTCACTPGSSPIVIDLDGNGIALTSAVDGVWFDIRASGQRHLMSWTQAASKDAFLVLDRNENGLIDDGSELFGNFTDQPSPPPGTARNGFIALGVFDTAAKGGDGDGQITAADAVFGSLRLWLDGNHDGVSQPSELVTLPEAHVVAISLNYRLSKQVDQFGNKFRYWGFADVAEPGRKMPRPHQAVDVILATIQ